MANIVINAGPGSGKTFTLENTYKFLLTNNIIGFMPTQEQYDIFAKVREMVGPIHPYEAVFLAFNKNTQQKMESELPKGSKVYTFHGIGHSQVIRKHGHQEFFPYRDQMLLSTLLGRPFDSMPIEERRSHLLTLKYIKLLKEELLPPSPESIDVVQEKYALEAKPDNIELINNLMKIMTRPNGYIGHDDQVWLGLQSIPPTPPYKIALVDECQDLSALRLEFCLRIAQNCVFCGDPYQSINAFAGADFDAFEKIRVVSKAELPLKTCFRCPPNRIRRINDIRPARIVAYKKEDGPEERVSLNNLGKRILELTEFHTLNHEIQAEYLQTKKIPEKLPQTASCLTNYLIVARTNANLIRIGLRLGKLKIPCKIMRRSDELTLDEILIKFMKSLKPNSLEDLRSKLALEIQKCKNLPPRQAIAIDDKCRALIYASEECKHLNQLSNTIKNIHSPSDKALGLSTVHSAKGLEAPFVFIAFPPIPHPMATTPNQIEQEINLEFVAESRSSYYTGYIIE